MDAYNVWAEANIERKCNLNNFEKRIVRKPIKKEDNLRIACTHPQITSETNFTEKENHKMISLLGEIRQVILPYAVVGLIFTSQIIPNGSTHIPNVSPQGDFVSGCVTSPLAESFT